MDASRADDGVGMAIPDDLGYAKGHSHSVAREAWQMEEGRSPGTEGARCSLQGFTAACATVKVAVGLGCVGAGRSRRV